VRPARIDSLLGMEVPRDRVHAYLDRLGFGSADDGDAVAVTVPADRYYDITREVDVIEEIARVHGLDEHLPATLPDAGGGPGRLERHQRLLRRIEDVLVGAGVDEAVTWSFDAPERAASLNLEGVEPVRVHNPLSEEGSAMRTELLAGLLAAASHNVARGNERVALFESGRAYLPQAAPSEGGVLAGAFAGERPSPVAEPHRIGCVLSGPLRPGSWRAAAQPADFYDAKGLVELVCAAVGAEATYAPAQRPFLHPARAAAVSVDGIEIGWVGELHPRLAREAGLTGAAAFEIDAGPLLAAAEHGEEMYVDFTTFPAVGEDIAVVADRDRSAEEIRAVVTRAGGELLRSVEVFDVYEGEQVPDGKRSLALRLEFASPERTLTDEDVAERRAAIVADLEALGATLRG
jgi:phenylalanyl-tRNA synthetase beta chain